MSSPAPAATVSPGKPTGNRYDTMFGSDRESSGDEDAGARGRRTPPPAAAGGGDDDDDDDDDDDEPLDDLFGEEDEHAKPTELSNADLASAAGSPPSDPAEPERFVEVALPRHPGPAPGSDRHLYLLKIPSFLSMEPQLFDPEKFVLPTANPDERTSAYTKATTSIRFRRVGNALQSNTRVIRWSDGSMSLQIASSPGLYDLPRKDLTSDPAAPDGYQPSHNSHTYLLDPHETAGTLRVVGQATQALNVVSASVNLASDHAIQRLHSELASTLPRSAPIEISELKDPEAERKEAERIAKERERANKKLEAQRRRARERDPLEAAARRSYAKVTGTRSKRDSPPILTGRGRGREDEYDLDDGFIEEGSDEEEPASDDDDDDDDERRPRRRRGESDRDRKRRRVVEDGSDDE